MTQPNAFCFWQLSPGELILVCDVRCGAEPVILGARSLNVCTIATLTSQKPPFDAACDFCRRLCPASLTPAEPAYGFNDWYYIYGNNSAESVLRDADNLAELTAGLANRPYCVIDAGWQLVEGGCSGGPFRHANRRFGDMGRVAQQLRERGVRPGIWMRPLMTAEALPDHLRCTPKLLDPSHPAALAYIADTIGHLAQTWGFDLVKHDFSTFDIFGKWGPNMLGCLTGRDTLRFQDKSRTTAEIVLSLYRTIRQAAGKAAIIGCNTIGHLAAGLIEVQRTGDDTSGRDWSRTLKMGINTLAFRMPQHGAFYAADADCAGITAQIPWALNRQWIDLLAHSGTPLFLSADPRELGSEQKAALREAFAVASVNRPTARPEDWMDTTLPQQWTCGGESKHYDWFSAAPVAFGLPSRDNLFA